FCYLDDDYFIFSSRRRHTIFSRDWSSDVCSSDLIHGDDLYLNHDYHLLPSVLTVLSFLIRGYCGRRIIAVLLTWYISFQPFDTRSEERRVGKVCKYRWASAVVVKDQ